MISRYSYTRWFYGLLLALIAVAIVTAFMGCSQKQSKEPETLPNGAMVRYSGEEAIEVVVEVGLVDFATSTGIVLRNGEVIPCRFLTIKPDREGGLHCIPIAGFPLSATRAGAE